MRKIFVIIANHRNVDSAKDTTFLASFAKRKSLYTIMLPVLF